MNTVCTDNFVYCVGSVSTEYVSGGGVRSFSTEQQAIAVSKQAVQRGFDTVLPLERRSFLYMPLMHSEQYSCCLSRMYNFGAIIVKVYKEFCYAVVQ